jgi:hypothetical protein
MTDKKISIPTVHMNGTSYADLLEHVLKAYRSLRDTEQALRDMTPNGKDYYIQGDGAGEEARRQHQRRLNAIRDIQEELEEIACGIQDQKRR